MARLHSDNEQKLDDKSPPEFKGQTVDGDEDDDDNDDEAKSMAQLLGFSGFGSTKGQVKLWKTMIKVQLCRLFVLAQPHRPFFGDTLQPRNSAK